MQEHINHILKFFQLWKLTINTHKTQAITFTRKTTELPVQISISGHPIPWVHKTKYLGPGFQGFLGPGHTSQINPSTPASQKTLPTYRPKQQTQNQHQNNLIQILRKTSHPVWTPSMGSGA